MTKPNITKTELLAPARDAATAMAAIDHGADAVYIGAPAHGARAAATNTIADIASVTEYAHRFNARVYATVNTIVYDSELKEVERMIRELYRIGVDALIVQDMSLLRLDIPPIDLHASTQCDIRTPERARFLAECGFSQLVLPRELTLSETAEIRNAIPRDVALEAFVHGALCVSYSGDCQAGWVAQNRSANRGECPQICRLPYNLTDLSGREILIREKHLLSLRDLNRTAHLAAMLNAGITSFKIEGRLKDPDYVKNVTAHYRRELDRIIDANPSKWRRASEGRSELTFTPDVEKSFNRGFTSYFTTTPRPDGQMASVDSPKWCGERVGILTGIRGNILTARLDTELSNGDGLGFFDASGRFCGFRLNKVDGNKLTAASMPGKASPGTPLFRNRDKKRDDLMRGETAKRTIDVDVTLRITPDGRPVADAYDSRGISVSVADNEPVADTAQSDQTEARRRTMAKTGNTIYELASFTDLAGDRFIPLSQLTRLRRAMTDALDSAQRATFSYSRRRSENPDAKSPAELTYHDNVANRIARDFYKSHGSVRIEPAIETTRGDNSRDIRVMTTRYCLRREFGECLRTKKADRKWPLGSLMLTRTDNDRMEMRVDFDCASCRMHIVRPGKP